VLLSDDDEYLLCNEKLLLLRLSWSERGALDDTAVRERCRDSGEDGVDAVAFEGGCSVTRAFTPDVGVSPTLFRVGLNGEGDRGVLAALTVILLVLAIELDEEGLRATVALLFTLAFGLKVLGGGVRDD
jgi:hypothetical protein